MYVFLPEIGKKIQVNSTPEIQDDLEVWRNNMCEAHENYEWRRMVTASGGLQIRRQCLECGHVIGGARKREPSDSSLSEIDEVLRNEYHSRRRNAHDEILLRNARLQYHKDTSWYKEYDEYLSSDAWAEKRRLVLKRSSGLCEGCGVARATQIHHLTYLNMKEEFLFELVAVCTSCHERLHANDIEDGPTEE